MPQDNKSHRVGCLLRRHFISHILRQISGKHHSHFIWTPSKILRQKDQKSSFEGADIGHLQDPEPSGF